MKKYVLIFLITFLLTGCKAVVNVTIDKNMISEEVNLHEDDSSKFRQYKNWNVFPAPLYYDQELDAPMWMPHREKESGVSYYDVVSDDKNHDLKITGKFNLKDHSRSYLVRNCFQFYNVLTEGQKTIFSTSKGLTCSFRDFSIEIYTPYVVTSSNAQGVDREHNIYTWNVTQSNYKRVGIYMEVDFSKKFNESKEDNNDKPVKEDTESKLYTYLAIGIIIVLLTLSGLYLYNKKRNLSDN